MQPLKLPNRLKRISDAAQNNRVISIAINTSVVLTAPFVIYLMVTAEVELLNAV